jgi:hypothetical protein
VYMEIVAKVLQIMNSTIVSWGTLSWIAKPGTKL